jgi:hypothetical protein
MSQPFGHDIPRLSWLGGKTHRTHFLSRKNRPGNSTLHAAAIYEDASRTLAVQVDKAYEADKTVETPVVPE